MEEGFVKGRLRLLLDHFAAVGDPREPAKIKYPLREVLFLVTCATIAGCDDFDEIADWGAYHLEFLRSHSEYYFGVPKEDWLRVVLNRIDPALFEACFTAWTISLRLDAADLVALDGKTLRRSGDSATGRPPLHLVSAWASTQRLVLAQEAVDAKENECAAILAILGRLSLKGALVTIDAIATNPTIAAAITAAGGDYITAETRYFVSSAALTPDRAAEAVRAHWGIESLHWVLDVTFKEDLSRLRRGHGAANMALVRRLAFNLVRAGRGKRSIKTARKAAAWNTRVLAEILNAPIR
jgi:predicted transposase YbfD/YdcC